MIDSVFLHEFKGRGSVKIGDWILWRKSLNLWNVETDEVINFKTLDEAMSFEIDGKTIKQIIADSDMSLFDDVLTGGNGAGGPTKEFSFGGGSGDGGQSKTDLPVKMNTKIKTKTADEAIKQFRNVHGNSKIEHAININANGYVSGYTHGVGGSVTPKPPKRGEKTVHNHPNRSYGKDSHFSSNDLLYTSGNKKSAGIVATFDGGYHDFTKGTHFKAEEFSRAVKKAKFKGQNYDTAATSWLRRNQKKYGYKYTLHLDRKTSAPKAKKVESTMKWDKNGQGVLF